MRRQAAIALAATLALQVVGGASPVGAARSSEQDYTITDLGLAPTVGAVDSAWVTGINAHQQIVGTVGGVGGTFGAHAAFEWQAATGIEVLPNLRSGVSPIGANGINDRGQIVGTGFGEPFAPGPTSYALLWQPDGTVQQLGAPGLCCSGGKSGTGINNQGHVVGNQAGRAFLWDPRGGQRDIGAFSPTAINNDDQVAGTANGQRAVVWDIQNGLRDLGTLPGSVQTFPTRINDRGEIVGQAYAKDGSSQAFLWDERLGMRALELLPGSTTSVATGINPSGRVVGTASARAFTWRAGVVQELPALPGIDAAHGMLNISVSAGAINNKGEIAGIVSWRLAANSAAVYNHVVLWKLPER